MTEPTDRPWILAHPAQTLAAIIERGQAEIGSTVIAAVDGVTRELLGVHRIRTPEPRPVPCYERATVLRAGWMLESMGEGDKIVDPDADLGEHLATVAEGLLPSSTDWRHQSPGSRGPYLFTVVCREGYTIQTATESQFRDAWRRARLIGASSGDVYVVTPHGWTGFLDNRCGLTPCVEPNRPALRAVPTSGC